MYTLLHDSEDTRVVNGAPKGDHDLPWAAGGNLLGNGYDRLCILGDWKVTI